MTSSNIINPEDKMLHIYIENLQKTIQSLCKIINTLVSEDQIVYQAYQNVKQILGEIKYYQKYNNKLSSISKYITHSISIIETHSQHQPNSYSPKQDFLPPVKTGQNFNLKSLATIAQKQSQQNLLHNYIRKQSRRKTLSKYTKMNTGNSKTINDPTNNLKTSRQYQIIREQTRRSLDNQGISGGDKKQLYKELQQFKGNQQIFPAVRQYLDKHNHKKYITSKNANYTISKFL